MNEAEHFLSWIEKLSRKLKENLPGSLAHKDLMPATRKEELLKLPEQLPRKSAVLLLFYPVNERPVLLFIKRAIDGGVHSNQIAFPGGQYEPADSSLQQTALRESNEEVNTEPYRVTILGSLTKLYIPPSNFEVTPFVGYTLNRPDFIPNEEVEKIMEISAIDLLKPESLQVRTLQYRTGKKIEVPCFYLDNEIVWGATAMIVNELIMIMRA